MRRVAIIAVVLVLTGCGGHSARSAEDIARDWSAALDKSDNEAAGSLFAAGAEVIQNGRLVLSTHRDAVQWSASLPCGGRITRVVHQGKNQVLVVFKLTERPGHHCDGPGLDAAAIFRVEHGKIVSWEQTVPPGEPPTGPAI